MSSAAEIEGLATGPYAALAAEHLPDDDLATLVPAVGAVAAAVVLAVLLQRRVSGPAAAGY